MAGIRTADHYAQIWNQSENKRQALEAIVRGFLDEFPMLVANYGAATPGDMIKVIDQQQKKWAAMCHKAEGDQLKLELFDRMLKSYDSTFYNTWKDVKFIEKTRTNGESA